MMPATNDKSKRSWPERFFIAILRPFYAILFRPFARPVAWRLRRFFLAPAIEQIEALRRDLAGIELKLGVVISSSEAARLNMQRLENSMNEIRREIQSEIAVTGRSIEAVLASLSVASERP